MADKMLIVKGKMTAKRLIVKGKKITKVDR